MEEADDDLLHLLSNCEKGLRPAGFGSVDDAAMQCSCDENGLEFPEEPMSDGSDMLLGSSISGDESIAFSSVGGSERGSHSELEFEEAFQDEEIPGDEEIPIDEEMPCATSYPGVDMEPWFNKRKPLEEQGQALLANAFCFFAKLPRQLRSAIGTVVGAGRGTIASLAARCCGFLYKRTVLRLVTGVQGNNWIPVPKLKRGMQGCRRRVATQTEDASGRGKSLKA